MSGVVPRRRCSVATKSEHDSDWVSAEEERFRARMQAQCREIAAYRKQVMRSECRVLTLDQAAHEWIARYAQSFSARWRNP